MRFYIAVGNTGAIRANKVAEVMEKRGHEHSFDRSQRGGGDPSELAFSVLRSVRDAELVLALLPGGNETHVELGFAIATRGNKRIVLWSETGDEFEKNDRACAFYYHPAVERVSCPFDELLVRLNKDQFGSELK